MPLKESDVKWYHYLLSVACGLTGSLASLSMKYCLQDTNTLYHWIYQTQNAPWVCSWTMRVVFA